MRSYNIGLKWVIKLLKVRNQDIRLRDQGLIKEDSGVNIPVEIRVKNGFNEGILKKSRESRSIKREININNPLKSGAFNSDLDLFSSLGISYINGGDQEIF